MGMGVHPEAVHFSEQRLIRCSAPRMFSDFPAEFRLGERTPPPLYWEENPFRAAPAALMRDRLVTTGKKRFVWAKF